MRTSLLRVHRGHSCTQPNHHRRYMLKPYLAQPAGCLSWLNSGGGLSLQHSLIPPRIDYRVWGCVPMSAAAASRYRFVFLRFSTASLAPVGESTALMQRTSRIACLSPPDGVSGSRRAGWCRLTWASCGRLQAWRAPSPLRCGERTIPRIAIDMAATWSPGTEALQCTDIGTTGIHHGIALHSVERVVCCVPRSPHHLLCHVTHAFERCVREWRRSSSRPSTPSHRLRRAGRSPTHTWRPTSRNGGRPAPPLLHCTTAPAPLVSAVDGAAGTRGLGATDEEAGVAWHVMQIVSRCADRVRPRGQGFGRQHQGATLPLREAPPQARRRGVPQCVSPHTPRVCIEPPPMTTQPGGGSSADADTGRCSGALQRRHGAGAFQGARRGKRVGVAAAHHGRLV